MKIDRLLAKSWNGDLETAPEPIFLVGRGGGSGHLHDVLASARTIIDATGADQLSAVGITDQNVLARFRRIVEVSTAIHDLGKANDHFQRLVRRQLSHPQGLRHEWLSVLICWDEQFGLRDWLMKALSSKEDFLIALWAVAGHHPAYGRPSPPRTHVEGAGNTVTVLTGHNDFREALDWIGSEFSLGKRPGLRKVTLPLVGTDDEGKENVFRRIYEFYRESRSLWERWVDDATGQGSVALVAAVKNCLVAADIAGSALPEHFVDAPSGSEWITAGFANQPSSNELAQLIADRLNVKIENIETKLHEFQKEVGKSKTRVTFVKAGCGTGKTLAAYRRAQMQHPGRRLYICYPTTGTATEGFRDYLVSDEQAAEAAEAAKTGSTKTKTTRFGARLFHSRQDIDFEMFQIHIDANDQGDDLTEETETDIRIRSLEAWSTPIVCCTCDVVLGLVQNNRRGLYAWPALAGAAYVFDEIHAYDDRLFGALLRFLTCVRGVPVLLMTASLPNSRWMALQRCLKRIGESIEGPIPGPEELETLPRYHRHPGFSNGDDPLPLVAAELNRKSDDGSPAGKVLWVCNTVDRARDAWEAARNAELRGKLHLYHSRFRYEDRVAQHNDVIDSFKSTEPVLAITTQVAEMSLDLKGVSLLITDLAPASSIIQRLGRLNRDAKPAEGDKPDPPTMPFVVLEPQRKDGTRFHLPYTPEDLELANEWLSRLSASISQRDLAQQWEALCNKEDVDKPRRPAFVESAWFDGGPQTRVLELREGSPGVTALLELDETVIKQKHEELQDLRKSNASREEIGSLSIEIRRLFGRATIPMPPPPRWIRDELKSAGARKLRGAFVVTEAMIDYSAERGGKWQPQPPKQ